MKRSEMIAADEESRDDEPRACPDRDRRTPPDDRRAPSPGRLPTRPGRRRAAPPSRLDHGPVRGAATCGETSPADQARPGLRYGSAGGVALDHATGQGRDLGPQVGRLDDLEIGAHRPAAGRRSRPASRGLGGGTCQPAGSSSGSRSASSITRCPTTSRRRPCALAPDPHVDRGSRRLSLVGRRRLGPVPGEVESGGSLEALARWLDPAIRETR